MLTINLVFWLMALICFVCAAAKYPSEPGTLSLGWLGAAFIALIQIIALASGSPAIR